MGEPAWSALTLTLSSPPENHVSVLRFEAGPKYDFRFTPESGVKSDISPCPLRAKFGSRRSHSITSSASASSVAGSSMPSVLAVLRLTMNSNFVACRIGNSLGFSPLRIRAA